MPRRKIPVSTYSVPVRVLSLFLSCLLSLPGPVLQGQENSSAPTSEENSAPVADSRTSKNDTVLSSALPCPGPSQGFGIAGRNPQADQWGEITVATPKIWQFERVSALLDGLLRDVEGVSLADLTQLDPSQQNGAALKFVQSALEVGVQYDQAAAVNNSNLLSSYDALHSSQLQQLDQYNTYMQSLANERNRLAAQYSAATGEVNALEALQAAGTITDAQQKQLLDAVSRQTNTQASLAQVNSLISGAGAAPALTAPPTVTGTSVQGPASGSSMSSSLSGFSDVLKSLPQGVQNNLSSSLQSPSYPATKRLDNFITLLYERLAREISVLQDDLMHDPDNEAFLLQFDVGLYPSKKSKDHVARVEFNLDHCPGCKVYSLYPGQSSYNLANYSGASKRNSFWGNVLTLIGLGVSASYRRQTDTLQGSLVQSVYTAGFQNGVTDNSGGDAQNAKQSFGWYYGAAPFEQLVTPGIRSTFAMITVPRRLIDSKKDPFGKADAQLPFCIDAGWANRNDPLAQDSYFSAVGDAAKILRAPFYYPRRSRLLDPTSQNTPTGDTPPYDASVLTMRTSVKLPAFQDDYPLIAQRENKLHVLRMEYNTVYEPPDTAANTTLVQTTVQSSTQITNPATGQTTGQTATQTTGTAVTAVTAPGSVSNSANPTTSLDPLPCPKYKCAAIVIALDRPIDPNLAITVRGRPMMRVRDWRGRATSVLPPAQSGSDLAPSTNTGGALNTKQLAGTRSLLEIDQFAPNSWFALNSHELLLNVSEDVATDEEFPVIQLADASGAIVIPHDLRRGFTELLINGFRLRPQTDDSILQEIRRQSWSDKQSDVTGSNGPPVAPAPPAPPAAAASASAAVSHQGAVFRDVALSSTDPAPANTGSVSCESQNAPITFGPYPFSTFLPLFAPDPAARNFFAVMGETGNDLLIGFASARTVERDSGKTVLYNWLETKTQVILEDRDWDFAWSLSCDAQGELLACHLPREEISRVYKNFLEACPNDDKCPGLGPDRESLIQSLARTTAEAEVRPCIAQAGSSTIQPQQNPHAPEHKTERIPADGPLHENEAKLRSVSAVFNGKSIVNPQQGKPSSAQNAKTTESNKMSDADKLKALFAKNDLSDFKRAFVSTMQVSVEQADEEGKNVFYSPAPARIGFLPLSNDYWKNASFIPWEFDRADNNRVTIRECNYLPKNSPDDKDNLLVSVLGTRPWKEWLAECSAKTRPDDPKACPKMRMVPNRPDWAELADDDPARCSELTVPTAALTNDPLVFEMEFPPHPEVTSTSSASPSGNGEPKNKEKADVLRTTIAISRPRIGPRFALSEMQIRQAFEPPPQPASSEAAKENPPKAGPLTPRDPNVWQITIPVVNSACGDKIDLPKDLIGDPKKGEIGVEWRNGDVPMICTNPLGPEPSEPADRKSDAYKKWQKADQAWQAEEANVQKAHVQWPSADKAGRIRLYLEIPRAAISYLPDRVDVLRTTDEPVTWAVGRLPNLKRLLLPYHLTIDPLSTTQFTLQGENAGVIDAVVLQGGTGNTTTQLPVAKGLDFALVILPAGSGVSTGNGSAGNDTSNINGTGTNSETQITVDATKDSAGHVQMTTKNSSTPAKPAAKPGATPSKADDATSPPKALGAGTYAVIPFIRIGTQEPDPQTVMAANQKVTDATNKLKAAKAAQAKKDAVTKATTDLANAKAAAQKATEAKPPDQKAIASANQAVAAATKKLADATAAAKGAPLDDVTTDTAALTKAQAAAKAAAEPTALYMPLPVTDKKGKPLMFTIPEAKKPSTTTVTSGTPGSTTCAVPCLVAPCTVACPTTTQTTAPKTP
jgi:hypothetical protein